MLNKWNKFVWQHFFSLVHEKHFAFMKSERKTQFEMALSLICHNLNIDIGLKPLNDECHERNATQNEN